MRQPALAAPSSTNGWRLGESGPASAVSGRPSPPHPIVPERRPIHELEACRSRPPDGQEARPMERGTLAERLAPLDINARTVL